MNNCSIKLNVLRRLYEDKLFAEFDRACSGGDRSGLYFELYERGAENDLLKELCKMILLDDNAFSRTCARGDTPSAYLSDAYADDLNAIFGAASTHEGFRRGKRA